MSEKYLVTGALPYANGPVHIGHLAGVHLPADIYTRYLRKKGKDVIHICGTDEHGVPITLSAEKEEISPEKLVNYYHRKIEDDLRKINIDFDNFSGTSRKIHHELAQKFFRKLNDKGYIESKVTEELYCPRCKKFLPDRYVEGICPHCGFENARGDCCESCGSWLESDLLKEPRCKLCGGKPEKRETKHWYLLLNKFQEKLENWLDKKDWKKTVKKYLKGWLNEGLRPRAITRDLEWGVKVPVEEADDKVLYVWFDAPIGYISSTIEWAQNNGKPEKWKEYWMNEKTNLIHFIGKDNIVFHGLIWPAVLMGYGGYTLPTDIPANEYLNLEGRSMSTSRNWAVWLDDFVESFNPDFLRYYICLILPETKDSEFKWKEFQERINTELVNIFGNFVNRTLKFIERFQDSVILAPGSFSKEDKKLIESINNLVDEVGESLSNFKFRRAIQNFMQLAAEGNKYYDRMEPWNTRKDNMKRTGTTMYLCSHIVSVLANLGQIFIPGSAERIFSMMNLEGKKWEEIKNITLPENHRIGKVCTLYEKVEDEDVKKQIRRLNMEHVSIDDFKKLGLKVGIIEKVNDVEGADKLYSLEVDVGEDSTRTMVAGLKEHYTAEELEGMRVVVITNLEPATIMGVKSEGMLLAATEGGKVSIVSPDEGISPGSRVS